MMYKTTIFLFMLAGTLVFGQNAPIDFEDDGIGANWTWTVFENDTDPDLEIIDNPDPSGINTSSKVAKFTALETGQPFAGCESENGVDLGAFTWNGENTTVSIMVWKSEISDVGIKFSNPNGWAQIELKVANTVVNEWEELTFDFSGYMNPPDGEGGSLDQIIVFPDFQDRTSENVVYFDNISFGTNDGSEPDEGPMTAAPTPTEDEEDVYSLFSNTYINQPVDTWLTPWSNGQLEDLQIEGVDTKRYFNVDFVGVETTNPQIDATEYDFFHVDVWSNNAELFRVKLVNFEPGTTDFEGEGEIAFDLANSEWVSLQIPLNDFADADLVTDSGNLLNNRDAISQIIFSGNPIGNLEVYIDNVYFSKESMSSEEFETEVGFSMYPNPAKDLLTFESKLQIDEVSIFDMSGRQVKNSKNLNSPLDISNLKDGVYMVSTKIGDHMVVKKLIKH